MIASLLSKSEKLAKFIVDGYVVDVNCQLKSNGSTAFMIAVLNGYYEIAQEILQSDYDINLVDNNNNDALMTSCLYGADDLAKEILLNKNVIVNRQNKVTKQNAYMLACESEPMTDVCKIILGKILESSKDIVNDLSQEDVNGMNMLDYSLIYLSSDNEMEQLMKDVFEIYKKFDLIQIQNNTLFTKSTKKIPIVLHLIKWTSMLESSIKTINNINLNIYDNNGKPIINYVIEKYNKVKSVDEDYNKSYICSLEDSLLVLINNADINMFLAADKDGINPLMCSLKFDIFPIAIIKNIIKLLECGTGKLDSFEGYSFENSILLDGSLSKKYKKFINCPFDSIDKVNSSPLIYSIKFKRETSFDILLEYTNISLINIYDKTAFTYACSIDDPYYANKIITDYNDLVKSELGQTSGLIALTYCLNSSNYKIKEIASKILFSEHIQKQKDSLNLFSKV